jgi:RND family efflux transporter MFP subunit
MESEIAQNNASSPSPAAPRRFKRLKLFLVLAATGFICLALIGIAMRAAATNKFQKIANAAAQVNVEAVLPERSATSVTLQLPGNTSAYYQASIFAQTTGYLKKWYYDIGAQVKASDILAEIDTPEVDQELSQAQATLAMAKAQLALAEANYHEARDLFQRHVTSQRDLDTMQASYLAQKSTVDADNDAVQRLQALENFKTLRAPFAGIITARNTDIGDLVVSGADRGLFIVAQEDPLRVYVTVPENLAKEVRVGAKADLSFDEFPGRLFSGTVATTANAVTPTSRSLLTEIRVSNPSDDLWPGAYTVVHFHLATVSDTLLIPAATLIFAKQTPQVAVVATGETVELREVQIGRDLGTHLEIKKGLSASDRIIINPPNGLRNGLRVHIIQPNQSSRLAGPARDLSN